MTHILLEIKHIEKAIEDFVMKHLHMGSYKMVMEAKQDLHSTLLSQPLVVDTAVELPNVVEAPVIEIIAPAIDNMAPNAVPDEQPDATALV